MRLSKFKSSFLYNAIVHYNDLPADIKTTEVTLIQKRKLKNVLRTLLIPNNYKKSKKYYM